MKHQAQLDFFRAVLAKSNLRTALLGSEPLPEGADRDLFQLPSPWARARTVYKLLDPRHCCYIFLLLPGEQQALLAGPWLNAEPTRGNSRYYADVPVIRDTGALFQMVQVLGEVLWEGQQFSMVDATLPDPVTTMPEDPDSPEETLRLLKQLENRYAFENQFMATVAQGMEHRAEMMLRGFARHAVEQRSPDPVRDLKNYCIVCNTLLRKAAEQGGVHPLELDRTSSLLARRIEEQTAVEPLMELIRESARRYCRLVREQPGTRHSPTVRRAVACIRSDLAGDLSLHSLAAALSVNASYLSALFKRETGHTVTDYVNQARMELAARLLRNTGLQIQAVAQHCGISDVNYFSKLFKKAHGVTPKQFRDYYSAQ